jgi:macrolide-specific efflux system membrane fusion protein
VRLFLDPGTRRWRYALAAAVALAAALLAAGWWLLGRSPVEAARALEVGRGDIEVAILANGTVQPRNRLEIKPPLAGRVEQVLVQEGQVVGRGQIVAWMSSSERAALLDAARARGPEEVKRWEEFYKATPILSPIHGTVIKRNVEPGQSFTSADAVLVIADRLIVEALVDETDIAQVRPKQPAHITLDAYPGETIPAVVEAIAYEAKTVSNVTTYTVDVLPEKVPPFMRSGMTASVAFQITRRENVLRVPSRALERRDGRSYVRVTNGAGPEERAVEAGLTDGKFTEIVSGLSEGEKVTVAPIKTEQRAGGINPFSTWGRSSSQKK